MAKKRKFMQVDETSYTTVIRCDQDGCDWRALVADKGRAWYTLARHLKRTHGDMQATARARRNAWHLGISGRSYT